MDVIVDNQYYVVVYLCNDLGYTVDSGFAQEGAIDLERCSDTDASEIGERLDIVAPPLAPTDVPTDLTVLNFNYQTGIELTWTDTIDEAKPITYWIIKFEGPGNNDYEQVYDTGVDDACRAKPCSIYDSVNSLPERPAVGTESAEYTISVKACNFLGCTDY